jgi:glycine betaine catabolism B
MIRLHLDAKHHLLNDIWSFEFQPSSPLSWQAGQFIKVEVPHANPDAAGAKRQFTIAAAPHEGVIRIVTHISNSSFKQVLAGIQPRDAITLIDSPAGDFIWGTDPRPRLFVATGVGVTPFYAIVKDRVYHHQPIPARLIYAHPTMPLPLAEDFQTWTEQHPEFLLSHVPKRLSWSHLADLVPNLADHLVYVCGPATPTALLLPPYNLQPSQIKYDAFTGYAAGDY